MHQNILAIKINSVSYTDVVDSVLLWSRKKISHYVCIVNVHVTMEAYDSLAFRKIINDADLVTPDGMPLVWMMRLKGQRDQQRVYGPTLMLHLLERTALEQVPVGFYGSAPEVLQALVERMQSRFPGLQVAFAWSPPFGELSPTQDAETVEQINRSGARILFVGLGCPKQEIWMAEHRNRVNAVMLGVGAAFDFHAGRKPQAPGWMQGIGLEWLFRLFSEPRRLWKRYLYHNPRFVVLALLDLMGLLKTPS